MGLVPAGTLTVSAGELALPNQSVPLLEIKAGRQMVW